MLICGVLFSNKLYGMCVCRVVLILTGGHATNFTHESVLLMSSTTQPVKHIYCKMKGLYF